MSDSLPYSGVAIVEVMRNAVVAHACREKPPRSSAMVRIAVDTIVWSSAARNIAIIRPPRIVRICRWVKVSPAGAGAVPTGADVLKTSLPFTSRSRSRNQATPRAAARHGGTAVDAHGGPAVTEGPPPKEHYAAGTT